MDVDDNIEIVHAPGYEEEQAQEQNEATGDVEMPSQEQEVSTLESGELKSSQDSRNAESDYDSDDSDDINVQIGTTIILTKSK